tara:strand:+ start:22 stop:243 length:222 start_codon:yes stop_codon:yes gene_type:complete
MNKVNEIIAEHLNLDVSEVTDDKHIIDDLGADSLHTVELVMKFEEEFNFAILDEDADGLDTVGKIKEYIEENA